MKRDRPTVVEVGKAYRLRPWYGLRGPSDEVVLVTRIEHTTKTARTVWFCNVQEPDDERPDNYSDFLRRIWLEEKTAIN